MASQMCYSSRLICINSIHRTQFLSSNSLSLKSSLVSVSKLRRKLSLSDSLFIRYPSKRGFSLQVRKTSELGSLFVEKEQRQEKKEENQKNHKKEKEMTITPAVKIADRKLLVKERTILTDVPDNVISTSAATEGPVEGIFIGASFNESSNRHVVSLGTLRDVRFMACFRFKLWWMAQKMGAQGRDIPLETQFLLVETREGSHLESDNGEEQNQIVYTVFLPLIDGPFRACLQGNSQDELQLCFESGDNNTKSSHFTHSLFVSAGADPFATITDAIRAVKLHLKTFRQRHEKKLPGIVDYFGWCTWDAFYQEVTQEGVEAGLESLSAEGTPAKFVIIDDGWQSVGGDPQEDDSQDENKQQPLLRLTGIKENTKFQNKEDPTVGIKTIVNIAKHKYGLKYVYVWHAIAGYWGGVRPGVEGMEEYDSKMQYPAVSPGVVSNEPGWSSSYPLFPTRLQLFSLRRRHKPPSKLQ
ncbi:probable galactinol--sucrose galactosyltransferase 6 [Telopea speciosissima]|uniref:probable galactinol--sucrose galactosyltransferase 6 n=1 Tax=Telopea speciosissima TaxID=54955 RepID=UPI001CC66C16|nr:probable galactinol--sucrose galactosyltransferase 6 [Telopea speciosissima]